MDKNAEIMYERHIFQLHHINKALQKVYTCANLLVAVLSKNYMQIT